MNWYMAKLSYQFTCGSGMHTPEFNEQLRLIVADDVLHAFYKARLIGDRESVSVVKDGMAIEWKFVDVTDIFPVDNLSDGAEVWSYVIKDAVTEDYTRCVKQKAKKLLERSMDVAES